MLMVQVFEICPNCHGEGRISIPVREEETVYFKGKTKDQRLSIWVECLTCHGTGRVNVQNLTLLELRRHMEIPEPPLGAQI